MYLTYFSAPRKFCRFIYHDSENGVFFCDYYHHNFWIIFQFERFLQIKKKKPSIDFFETFPTHAWECKKLNCKVWITLTHFDRSTINDKGAFEPAKKLRYRIHHLKNYAKIFKSVTQLFRRFKHLYRLIYTCRNFSRSSVKNAFF